MARVFYRLAVLRVLHSVVSNHLRKYHDSRIATFRIVNFMAVVAAKFLVNMQMIDV